MSPVVPLPPLTLSSALYAAAYVLGCAAFYFFARHRRLATEGIGFVALVGLVGGVVGANLGQLLATGNAGKSVLGGIIGGYLCVWLAKKRLGLRRPTGDLFAVGLLAGEAVGRWGCFFGGCCYGKACTLPWAVYQHDALRHPTQFYLSLASALILAVVLVAEWRWRPAENGLWYLQGVLYCPARFGIEFLRAGATRHAGLSTAQWVCLIGLLFFIVRWAKERPFAQRRLEGFS